jgi:solute carrier family 25 phosphate transporter 23/24/25/41
MPESAIKFGSFEGAKRALAQLEGHGDPYKISSFSKFLAGGTGGVISQSVSTQISLMHSTNPRLG